jgi:hypothetical protein
MAGLGVGLLATALPARASAAPPADGRSAVIPAFETAHQLEATSL